MTLILNRYLFKQIALSTFLVTLGLTIALWLSQSLRFIDIVIGRGFSLFVFFKMVFFLLPDLIGIVLPISFLIALVSTYHRLLSDSELIIMRASGMSNFALTKPALAFSGGCIILLYAINLYFLPLSFRCLKDMEYHLRNDVTSYLVQPGEFTSFKDVTVYVRERHRTGELRGILVHDARSNVSPFTLIAERGLILENPRGLSIMMVNGHRQQVDLKTGKPSILSFQSYTLDFLTSSVPLLKRPRKPYEHFFSDLIYPNLAENPLIIRRLFIEVHQRLMTPLIVLCFTGIVLAFLLNGDYDRRGRAKKIFSAIGTCALLEVLIVCLLNLSEKFNFTLVMAYAVILFCLICAFRFIFGPRSLYIES